MADRITAGTSSHEASSSAGALRRKVTGYPFTPTNAFPLQIVLVGDSDISRWPEELLPTVVSSSDGAASSPVLVLGKNGATLDQTIPYVKDALTTIRKNEQSWVAEAQGRQLSMTTTVLVICAGENDIGNGIPLFKSEESLVTILGLIFGTRVHPSITDGSLHLIFLGPKFEPWLADDLDGRKLYVQMSRSFKRFCLGYTPFPFGNKSISYVDCLAMFCGESANLPGALLDGKAIPEARYFDHDQLHLSNEGYKLWKSVLEKQIQALT
jgi:lysophospholipase L1-like esterase